MTNLYCKLDVSHDVVGYEQAILLAASNRWNRSAETWCGSMTSAGVVETSKVYCLCCLSQAQRRLSDEGSSLCKQPGPAEALKQMLFRLQAVEAELQRQQPSPGASAANQRLGVKEHPVQTNVSAIWPRDELTWCHVFSFGQFLWVPAVFVLQRPEAGEDMESSPGGPSLQRYMWRFTHDVAQHLSSVPMHNKCHRVRVWITTFCFARQSSAPPGSSQAAGGGTPRQRPRAGEGEGEGGEGWGRRTLLIFILWQTPVP